MNTLFQLKISIDDCVPDVWRRIHISKDSTFFDLHVALQSAIGWTDTHLHSFYVSQKGTTRSIKICFPDPENDYDDDALDERKELISDYLGKSVKQIKYCYDFGDNWDHTIVLEREIEAEKGKIYPICVAGKNACPPEDCGGVWGYIDLQKVLKNPKSDSYDEMLEWLCIDDGNEFDATGFNLEDVDFLDSKERLREYEYNFKVPPLKSKFGSKKVSKNSDSTTPGGISMFTSVQIRAEKIHRDLQSCSSVDENGAKNIKRIIPMGVWEIAQRQEPMTAMIKDFKVDVALTIVVHQESYFILSMGVKPYHNSDAVSDFLLDAIEKHKIVPSTILIKRKDESLLAGLKELSNIFGFTIEQGTQKVAPTIFRDIKRHFNL